MQPHACTHPFTILNLLHLQQSLYVASKVPFVVEQAQAALLDGRYAPVIGIQTTGEAQIKAAMRRPRRRRNGAEEDDEDEDEICQVASTFEVSWS